MSTTRASRQGRVEAHLGTPSGTSQRSVASRRRLRVRETFDLRSAAAAAGVRQTPFVRVRVCARARLLHARQGASQPP